MATDFIDDTVLPGFERIARAADDEAEEVLLKDFFTPPIDIEDENGGEDTQPDTWHKWKGGEV